MIPKHFFSPCSQQAVCQNPDLSKVITNFIGENLFTIYTKDEPTFKEIHSVQNVCEMNIILFKIDCVYKTKLLFPAQPNLVQYVIEHTGILNKLCKYLFTNKCLIMEL